MAAILHVPLPSGLALPFSGSNDNYVGCIYKYTLGFKNYVFLHINLFFFLDKLFV